MFFEKDDGKRKYACFVCGFNFESLELMNNHILEKHEVGKEYVLCPLCNYCVRDLNMHAKIRHPGRPLPKYNGPNRAIVWKDQKTGKGKKSKKPAYREGHFVSLKNHGKEFFYRSSYECEILECLEQLNEVVAYDIEPLKTGIPYLYDGKQHHYFPDFSIQYADGHIEIWEIKPATQTMMPLNEAKWAAANNYCQIRGWEFIVITEVGIGKLKACVKKKRSEQ